MAPGLALLGLNLIDLNKRPRYAVGLFLIDTNIVQHSTRANVYHWVCTSELENQKYVYGVCLMISRQISLYLAILPA